jgi:hypothetical protein
MVFNQHVYVVTCIVIERWYVTRDVTTERTMHSHTPGNRCPLFFFFSKVEKEVIGALNTKKRRKQGGGQEKKSLSSYWFDGHWIVIGMSRVMSQAHCSVFDSRRVPSQLSFCILVTMALRRRAMNNASTSTPDTPNTPNTASPSPASPLPPLQLHTPRNRASIFVDRSPAATASRSSNFPFDWDAARARRPAPYATPQSISKASRRSVGAGAGTPRKGIVRKRGFFERYLVYCSQSIFIESARSITDIPSQIAFHIHMFPANVPLPKPQTSAWIIGGSLHFLHFCVRVTQIRQVPDSDLGWEDLYHEGEGHSWFDWVCLAPHHRISE